MASFDSLWKARNKVLEILDDRTKEAKAHAQADGQAALSIQRLFRGQFIRASVTKMRIAETTISRVYRGHRDRLKTQQLRRDHLISERMAIYEVNALRIQTRFRGYVSRVQKHNFRARQAYIRQVAETGEVLRSRLREQFNQQQQDQLEQEQNRMRKEFTKVTQHLHHLLGTQSVSGIYGPSRHNPYLEPPTVAGVPVEAHIQEEVAKVLHERRRHRGKVAHPPPVMKPNRASLRATSSYQAEKELKEQQKRRSQLRRISPLDFNTSCKSYIPAPKYTPGINDGAKYMDGYRNPYLKRGIPQSKRDLDPDHSTLEQHPATPFYTATAGKKDKVLPNGLFE